MKLQDFLSKYDNGAGLPLSGNKKIHPSEVKAVRGSYDSLKTDFLTLSENDQRGVSTYFRSDVAFELLQRIDANYRSFRSVFDNGNGLFVRGKNDFYAQGEIVAGGGFTKFLGELQKLHPAAQLILKERLDPEVLNTFSLSPLDLFWLTYDNGAGVTEREKDGLLGRSELVQVGWDQFLKDLALLSPEEGIRVLNALKALPPEPLLSQIRNRFPKYTDPYNFSQFPRVTDGTYGNIRLGMDAIRRTVGSHHPSEISLKTIRPFGEFLPIDSEEVFYIRLHRYLNSRGPEYKMTIHEFSRFVYEHSDGKPEPVAIHDLIRALEQKPARYGDRKYTVNAYGFIGVSDIHRTDRVHEFQINDDLESRKKLIQKLKSLKIHYIKDRYETVKGYSHRYTFEIPEMEARYTFVMCDQQNQWQGRSCMPLLYTKRFPKYKVNGNEVEKLIFNKELVQLRLFNGANLKVMARKGSMIYDSGLLGLAFLNTWFLEPDFDIDVEWNLFQTRRVR